MCGSSGHYRLSPLAQADLEAIWLYTFETWSLDQADRYVRDLIAVLEDLAAGRRTGRRVDVRAGYFKYGVGAHFVFYRDMDGHVDVIRILHQQMDVKRHL